MKPRYADPIQREIIERLEAAGILYTVKDEAIYSNGKSLRTYGPDSKRISLVDERGHIVKFYWLPGAAFNALIRND